MATNTPETASGLPTPPRNDRIQSYSSEVTVFHSAKTPLATTEEVMSSSHPQSPATATDANSPSNAARNHAVACLAEFIGTYSFLFFAFAGTQVANGITTNEPQTGILLYISLAFAVSLATNVWIFYRISGGMFNPAVTFGLFLAGAVPLVRAILCIISQILGAIAAAAVISGLFPGDMKVQTSLSPVTSVQRGLFIEMFLTANLVLTILFLAVEKHKATFLAPIGIGMSLFICELSGVPFTGGSLNPARSFGPDVVLQKFHGHHWIYWMGPLLGAALAAGIYKLMKFLRYETANPGQDMNDVEALAASRSKNAAANDKGLSHV